MLFAKQLQTLSTSFREGSLPKRFIYSTVHINFDSVADEHVDKDFLGRSVIFGWGCYNDGALVFHSSRGDTEVDIAGRYVAYWGDERHSSKRFSGSRTPIVLYLSKAILEADWDLLKTLKGLGFMQGGAAAGQLPTTVQAGAAPEGLYQWLEQKRKEEAEA